MELPQWIRNAIPFKIETKKRFTVGETDDVARSSDSVPFAYAKKSPIHICSSMSNIPFIFQQLAIEIVNMRSQQHHKRRKLFMVESSKMQDQKSTSSHSKKCSRSERKFKLNWLSTKLLHQFPYKVFSQILSKWIYMVFNTITTSS